MAHYSTGSGRAITDYFNSPAFHAPQEGELLAAILTELMHRGQPTTSKVIITAVIARLEGEVDEAKLQGYRSLLTQLLEEKNE